VRRAKEGRLWKLRFTSPGKAQDAVDELTFHSEGGFTFGLQTAYKTGASDLVARLPDGQVLLEAALRERYPPK
jgi:hypothetical protein